jgi:hypothetical protein
MFGKGLMYQVSELIHSHAEGENSFASGRASHAEGFLTGATRAYASHAERSATIANNLYAHAEGNRTQAVGIGSHAEGNRTHAVGIGSHAEGNSTIALGSYSHAEGNNSQSIGNYSSAMGIDSKSRDVSQFSTSGIINSTTKWNISNVRYRSKRQS